MEEEERQLPSPSSPVPAATPGLIARGLLGLRRRGGADAGSRPCPSAARPLPAAAKHAAAAAPRPVLQTYCLRPAPATTAAFPPARPAARGGLAVPSRSRPSCPARRDDRSRPHWPAHAPRGQFGPLVRGAARLGAGAAWAARSTSCSGDHPRSFSSGRPAWPGSPAWVRDISPPQCATSCPWGWEFTPGIRTRHGAGS